MYQVIKMYGDFEPWWFLDGWEEDVTSRAAFDRYEDALNAFQRVGTAIRGFSNEEK